MSVWFKYAGDKDITPGHPGSVSLFSLPGGGAAPSTNVLISNQTLNSLNATISSASGAESFVFGGSGQTFVTNGSSVTNFYYTTDTSSNFSLDLTGLTSLYSVGIDNNLLMSTAPDLSGLTSLNDVSVVNNVAMVNGPDLSGCTSLSTVVINYNNSMTGLPDFTGSNAISSITMDENDALTSAPNLSDISGLISLNFNGNDLVTSPPIVANITGLTYATINDNDSMATAPSFSGCTGLITVNLNYNASMTTAPNYTGCSSLQYAYSFSNPSMTAAPVFTGCVSLTGIDVSGCAISSSNLLAMCAALEAIFPSNGSGKTLNMDGGTNGDFDGQNLPSQIQDLINSGWSVVFNDNNPL